LYTVSAMRMEGLLHRNTSDGDQVAECVSRHRSVFAHYFATKAKKNLPYKWSTVDTWWL